MCIACPLSSSHHHVHFCLCIFLHQSQIKSLNRKPERACFSLQVFYLFALHQHHYNDTHCITLLYATIASNKHNVFESFKFPFTNMLLSMDHVVVLLLRAMQFTSCFPHRFFVCVLFPFSLSRVSTIQIGLVNWHFLTFAHIERR